MVDPAERALKFVRARLSELVAAVCPHDGIGGVPGAWRVDYRPEATQGQRDAADALVASFDPSPAAQAAWDNLQARGTAKADLLSVNPAGKLIRSLLGIIIDEFNLLRAIVIGEGSLVWDVPNIANATGATSANITVTGAALGDYVDVSASISFGGLVAFGYVSAANTVNIRLHNGTGAAVNPASGTYKVLVRRQVSMAPRTAAQLKTAINARIDSGTED